MNGWTLADVRALSMDEYNVLVEEMNRLAQKH
jgi:hypothetical protein